MGLDDGNAQIQPIGKTAGPDQRRWQSGIRVVFHPRMDRGEAPVATDVARGCGRSAVRETSRGGVRRDLRRAGVELLREDARRREGE